MSGDRVLCIAGSPRRGGNSDRFLEALVEGVRAAGGAPTVLIASQSGVAMCRGCNACSRSGACVLRDPMDEVNALIDAAAAIAVATPVYFATVPASLKVVYDRCQPYWARRFVLGEPPPAKKRPGALVVVGGGGDPFGTRCAVTPTSSVFAVLGFSLDEIIEVVGPDAPGDAERFTDGVERARAAGVRLVESIVP